MAKDVQYYPLSLCERRILVRRTDSVMEKAVRYYAPPLYKINKLVALKFPKFWASYYEDFVK